MTVAGAQAEQLPEATRMDHSRGPVVDMGSQGAQHLEFGRLDLPIGEGIAKRHRVQASGVDRDGRRLVPLKVRPIEDTSQARS